MTRDLTRVLQGQQAAAAPVNFSQMKLVGALFDAAATAYPNHPAVRFRGTTTSYVSLAARVQAASGVLRRLGSGPGVCVGLLLPSCPPVFVYTLAAFATGAAVVALNPDGATDDLVSLARASGVTVLVTCDLSSLQTNAANIAQSGAISAVIVVSYAALLTMAGATAQRLLGANQLGGKIGGIACPVYWERDLLHDKSAETVTSNSPTPRAAGLDDAAFIASADTKLGLQTATLTHANLAGSAAQIRAALPALVPGGERILAALPVWHSLAWTITTALALTNGSELSIGSENDAATLISDMARSQPTLLALPATRLAALLAHPRLNPQNFAALRCVLIVGGTITPALTSAFAAISSATLLECYAPSSLPILVAVAQLQGSGGSGCGQPVMGTRISVRDLADLLRGVPRGERGELCISGPQVPSAEHVQPNTTTFVGSDLRTGDLATIDAEGRIIVIDRVEDLIIAAGYLIHPRRIEVALMAHPGVIDAAVIGIDDGRRGQAPKAFVVLNRGIAITERDLRLFLAEKISQIEMPADIDFTTSLPRTPYGLVCKTTLRRQEAVRRAK